MHIHTYNTYMHIYTYCIFVFVSWPWRLRTYERAILHVWMSHVARMNEPCRTYEWALSLIYMSHVTHVTHMHGPHASNLPHTWMCHDTYMHEFCHTYEGVMSHLWRNYVTHLSESCHIYTQVMSHIHYTEPSASEKEPSCPSSFPLALSLSLYPSPTPSLSLSLVDIHIMSDITHIVCHIPVHVWHCALCIPTTERERVIWLRYVWVHHAGPPANKREPPSCIVLCVCLMTICVFDTTHYAYIIWRHITLYAWHHSLCIHHLEPPAKEESASSIYCYMWVWHHSWCMHHTTSYNVKRHTIIWCDITPRHYAYVVCIIHGVATMSRLPNNIGL